jgi:hypothetical protein
MESGRMESMVAGWVLAVALLVAPLLLALWPELAHLRVAAVSPVMGFLVLLPSTTFSSTSAVLGSAAPWWLSPALNLGAALLFARRRKVTTERWPVSTLPSRPEDGLLSRWVERLAVWWEDPVLVRELRVGARRGPGRQWLAKAGVVALVLLLMVAFSPRLIEDVAEGVPVLLEHGNPGEREPHHFYASLLAVMILTLSWPMVLTSPVLGASTFSGERRKGTLGFLLITPLSAAEIARGKLLGALAPLLLTLAITLPLAAAAAGLALLPASLWTFLFSYAWLLVACFTGGVFGMLASLLWPADNDPQAPPLLAMFLLQGAKLYLVARLQLALTGGSWVTSRMDITAWYVVPLVAVEAGLGLLAYRACIVLLARARRQDLRFVTEK